jgi:hypothetical protein
MMLIVGGVFGGIASMAGQTAVILLLSALSLIGAGAAWRLDEVQ